MYLTGSDSYNEPRKLRIQMSRQFTVSSINWINILEHKVWCRILVNTDEPSGFKKGEVFLQ